MRREDVADFFRLRRFTANPWEIVRFRKRQSSGEELQVRFRNDPPLWLQGGRADFHMFHRIFLRDEYRLRSVAPSALPCVVDLGANVGVFAVRAARIARRVVAFEPNPVNFERLTRNTEDLSHVVIDRRAVAGKPGSLRLYRPRAATMTGAYSSFSAGNEHLSDEYDEVSAVTLDGILADHAIEACSLLKIDIEGQEYEVLSAASDATLGRIQRIHGEYHNVEPATEATRIETLQALLVGKGFEVEVIPHRRKPNHGMFYAFRPGHSL
jgi:FkbM family methyltransferase